MSSFDLIISDKESLDLENIFLSEENRKSVQQVIKEHRFFDELDKYGLAVDNKILFHVERQLRQKLWQKRLAKIYWFWI